MADVRILVRLGPQHFAGVYVEPMENHHTRTMTTELAVTLDLKHPVRDDNAMKLIAWAA